MKKRKLRKIIKEGDKMYLISNNNNSKLKDELMEALEMVDSMIEDKCQE